MDLDLVRRMERFEAELWTDAVAGAPRDVRAALGLAAVPIAGGVALRCDAFETLLFNRAFGFGLEGPFGPGELEGITALYPRERAFTIQPSAACVWPGASGWLEAHGMPSWFVWVCWQRPLAGPPPSAVSPCRVERIAASDAGRFADTCRAVFGMPETRAWLAALVGREAWHHYLAFDDDEPVGCGLMFTRGGLAWLGWGGTLPAHRGRGVQSTLLARRLADAAALGATHARVETADDTPERPNPSYRNVRRAGFEILQRRPSHAHVPPGSDIKKL